jgi:hypothetical protein
VTRDYLITGLLGDYLRLFRQIVDDHPAARRA